MTEARLRNAEKDFQSLLMTSSSSSSNENKQKDSSVTFLANNDFNLKRVDVLDVVDEKMSEDDDNKYKKDSLKGDRSSIALLMFLYVLQGIPLGIAASIPYLLQSRKISYKDQAAFSFVYWPFSLKLFWAPIVDSVYWSKFGKRKSWLVPTQYLIGFFMLFLSMNIESMMGDGQDADAKNINILLLTVVFFMLNFLAATQDIAVDGWALTMLSKRNVGWVSTCNTVGQTAGYFMGNVVFLALESADFSNRYLRTESQKEGVITLAGFLYMWSIVFFISTTLVMIIKHERDATTTTTTTTTVMEDEGVFVAYQQLWKIIQLPSIVSLIVILLTIKVGFAAADAVTGLKLIEEGVPKEHLAMMAVPMVPIDIILPIIITRFMSSQRPLDLLLKGMPFRLLIGLGFALLVWWAPNIKSTDGTYPIYFYIVLLVSFALHQVAVYCMFVPTMAFFAKISDPVIGGTYMTLLNTVSNLGGNWPSTVSLWLVDILTWKGCSDVNTTCSTESEKCVEPIKLCTLFDGYYIESVVCFFLGFIWLKMRSNKIKELQELSSNHWTFR